MSKNKKMMYSLSTLTFEGTKLYGYIDMMIKKQQQQNLHDYHNSHNLKLIKISLKTSGGSISHSAVDHICNMFDLELIKKLMSYKS